MSMGRGLGAAATHPARMVFGHWHRLGRMTHPGTAPTV